MSNQAPRQLAAPTEKGSSLSERLTETLADVLGLLHRAAWDVMDEEQRDDIMQKVVLPRWGKTTADGHVLKGTKWAEILGTTVKTIEGRYYRLREEMEKESSRSAGISDSPTSLTPAQKADRRAARQLLRNPDTAAELLADPDVREAVEEVRRRERVEHMESMPTVDYRQSIPNTAAFVDRLDGLNHLDRSEEALDAFIRSVHRSVDRISADDRAEMKAHIDRIEAKVAWCRSYSNGDDVAAEAEQFLRSLA